LGQKQKTHFKKNKAGHDIVGRDQINIIVENSTESFYFLNSVKDEIIKEYLRTIKILSEMLPETKSHEKETGDSLLP
jgi:hypothetical protein